MTTFYATEVEVFVGSVGGDMQKLGSVQGSVQSVSWETEDNPSDDVEWASFIRSMKEFTFTVRLTNVLWAPYALSLPPAGCVPMYN